MLINNNTLYTVGEFEMTVGATGERNSSDSSYYDDVWVNQPEIFQLVMRNDARNNENQECQAFQRFITI